MWYTKTSSKQEKAGAKAAKFVKLDRLNVTCVLLAVMGLALLGCNTMMDHISPAPVSPLVTEYVGYDVPEFMGFTTLYHVRHLDLMLDITHKMNQLKFIRAIEDDNLKHEFAAAYNSAAKLEGQTFQDIVVGSEGNPFSIAGLLATAAPGLMLGRAMKRKQDYSPEQVKKLTKDVEKRTRAKVLAEVSSTNEVTS